MAIPAALMDSRIHKRIDELGEIVARLENQVAFLEEKNRELEEEVKTDIHEHVRALVRRTNAIEQELKELKSKIRFPID